MSLFVIRLEMSPWEQFLNTSTREEGQYQNADFVFKKMRIFVV